MVATAVPEGGQPQPAHPVAARPARRTHPPHFSPPVHPTQVDDYVTHTLPLASINDAFDLLHGGTCLRCVMEP